MLAGFRCWDEQGQLIVDSTTFGGRVLGSFDASADSGSFSDSRLSEGTPFVIPLPTLVSTSAYGLVSQSTPYIPKITISGNTVTWTRGSFIYENRGTCLVFYGIY